MKIGWVFLFISTFAWAGMSTESTQVEIDATDVGFQIYEDQATFSVRQENLGGPSGNFTVEFPGVEIPCKLTLKFQDHTVTKIVKWRNEFKRPIRLNLIKEVNASEKEALLREGTQEVRGLAGVLSTASGLRQKVQISTKIDRNGFNPVETVDIQPVK